MSYTSKVHYAGPDALVVESGGAIRAAAGSAAVADLIDNSGGTASNTIPAIGAAYSQAEVRNAVASLAAKINALNAALKAVGITV